MQFNGEANRKDLCSDADYWAGTNSTTYPIEDKARNASLALDSRIVPLILRSDNTWTWDDFNATTVPIGTTDLVANQEDLSVAVEDLKIIRVRVKDPNGNWITLAPKSRRALTDAELAATGTPSTYDKIGGSFFLNPVPDYASEDGFEVQVQRGSDGFTKDDTVKEPGIPSPFHRLVSLYMALDYTEAHGLAERSTMIRNRIGRPPGAQGPQDEGAGMERELVEFFADRDRDGIPNISLERDIEAF